MIKYNLNTINDWNFGDDNIIKVYRNNAICYYKITGGGDTPTAQTPCFAVVDDISQYSDTEFEDVFNKADNKWYKLNNLNNYEEYGVYGSGRTITTYDGKLTIDGDYEYMYSGGSWVNVGEVSGSTATLPDVPFTLNYNAKEYNPSTHTIPYTEGALNAIDAVITGTTANIIDHHEDGYIQLTGSTSTAIRALVGTTNFSRSSSNPNITIICKAYTPGSSSEGNILSNRNESYNWMYRHKSAQLRFHGASEQGSIAVSNTEPNTCSVRIDSSRLLKYNNWTQNTTSTYSNFSYGSNSNGGALFSGYYSLGKEMWKGVFYWIYMSLNTLTDEQVQQVIDYNEGGGGEPEYPKYYDEIQDPPDNLVFSSMIEAEEYECPWVGMKATINGDKYVFSGDSQSGYEWVYNPSRLPIGYTEVEYIQNTGNSTVNLGIQLMANVGDTYGVVLDNEMSWTSGGESLQTFLTCCKEVASVYPGWYYRYNSSTNIVIAGSTSVITSTSRTLVSGSTYHTTINGTTPSNMSHNYPLNLFSSLDSTKTPWRFCKGKLYNMQVTYNNTLVRDLVPCIRDNDNTVGAYDIVNNVFYTSESGYDALVAGNPV